MDGMQVSRQVWLDAVSEAVSELDAVIDDARRSGVMTIRDIDAMDRLRRACDQYLADQLGNKTT